MLSIQTLIADFSFNPMYATSYDLECPKGIYHIENNQISAPDAVAVHTLPFIQQESLADLYATMGSLDFVLGSVDL